VSRWARDAVRRAEARDTSCSCCRKPGRPSRGSRPPDGRPAISTGNKGVKNGGISGAGPESTLDTRSWMMRLTGVWPCTRFQAF